jgi:hypothetical protein
MRALLTTLLLLASAGPASAQLDPQRDKPYALRVVLHLAPHRLFTPLFQEQLQNDLRDQLRLALGPLATVEVVRDHPLLPGVLQRGLDAALDGLEEVSPRKTHFVLLDYDADQYRLQAKQYDGVTGRPSAVVRRVQTHDRSRVATLAAQLVEDDFGIVGTVTQTGKEFQLTLMAADRGDLARWVKPGDVFAVSRLVQAGPRVRAERLASAYLEVLDTPNKGVCRCRYWHRYQEDRIALDAPGVLGYRALKLTTVVQPVRVRLLDDESDQPLAGMHVQVLRAGQDAKTDLTTNRQGTAVTKEPFSNLALVRLLEGDRVRSQVPFPLVDDRPLTVRFQRQPEADSFAALEFRRDAWLRRLYENLALASERSAEANRLLAQSLQAAFDHGQAGAKVLDGETQYLTSERDELQQMIRTQKTKRFDLREGEQRLEELKRRHAEVVQFTQRLEVLLKDPGGEASIGLQKMLERARLLEGEADFAPAIAIYTKVLQASPDQAKVKEHLAKLESAWAVKNDKHAAARAFVYQTWAKLEPAHFKDHLAQAKEAAKTLRDVDDRLTLQKFALLDNLHAGLLKKRLDQLRQRDSEDNRNQARQLVAVVENLRALHAEITAWLQDRAK